MRILAIHRYYWPDTPPYALMLRKIVQRWGADGHDVEVLSSQPSYKASLANQKRQARETVDGAAVHRLNLPPEAGRPLVRILNTLRLCMSILIRALVGKRYDVIMISTSPPVLGGAAAALAAKLTGARFIYHCMDIHPEIGRISGEFRNPVVFRCLRAVDAWSCRQARPVVVLSEDMRHTLEQRPGGARQAIQVINNFSLPDESQAPEEVEPPRLAWVSPGVFTLLFAGNIGRFQGLETLIEAMAAPEIKRRDDIQLVLMGDGVKKSSLEALARKRGARVVFEGHQPVSVAKAAMGAASAGFVSLVPGLHRYAFPSKTMTYLEQGCPLIVAVEAESELAREVQKANVGVVVAPGDPAGLAGAIAEMADRKSESETLKARVKQLAESRFSESAVMPFWSSIVHSNHSKDGS